MKKFTIEDVQAYLNEHDTNHDCSLLSTEYINSKAPLLFRCNNCNQEFKRTFANVRRNEKYLCARCAQGRNLSIEDVKRFLQENDTNQDCSLLSTHYCNYHTPLEFQCNCCGEKFSRTMAQLKQKHFKCPTCLRRQGGLSNKLSFSDIQHFIKVNDINNDCTLLSTEYKNQDELLLFRCNICGNVFERTYATMRAKRAFKCFKCAHHIDPKREPKLYDALKTYFRSKTYAWKKDFLNSHTQCDISGVKQGQGVELDIHHLESFSTILNQASENTGIPLIYTPQQLDSHGYSLELLTNGFLRLHNNAKAVLLDKKIHQLFHKLYGYKNNTPQQYYEFKQKYLEGEIQFNEIKIREH